MTKKVQETYKHIICHLVNAVWYYVLVYRINRENQMEKTLITLFVAAILNFRELSSLKYMTL